MGSLPCHEHPPALLRRCSGEETRQSSCPKKVWILHAAQMSLQHIERAHGPAPTCLVHYTLPPSFNVAHCKTLSKWSAVAHVGASLPRPNAPPEPRRTWKPIRPLCAVLASCALRAAQPPAAHARPQSAQQAPAFSSACALGTCTGVLRHIRGEKSLPGSACFSRASHARSSTCAQQHYVLCPVCRSPHISPALPEALGARDRSRLRRLLPFLRGVCRTTQVHQRGSLCSLKIKCQCGCKPCKGICHNTTQFLMLQAAVPHNRPMNYSCRLCSCRSRHLDAQTIARPPFPRRILQGRHALLSQAL